MITNLFIFGFGLFISLCCLIFLVVTIVEMRKI